MIDETTQASGGVLAPVRPSIAPNVDLSPPFAPVNADESTDPWTGPFGRIGPDATLASMLQDRAATDARVVGFTFLTYRSADTPDVAHMTFGDLLVRAQSIAASLQESAKKGARVLIVCPPGLDYIASFFGCMLAGMAAVPAYPPRNAKHLPRLQAIVSDAGVTAVLAPDEVVERLAGWAGGAEQLPRLIVVDQIDSTRAAAWVDPHPSPDELAILQYTSGTTSVPKGVMVRHAQVLENMRRIGQQFGLDADPIGAFWLPPYHDMGLIGGVLMPVACGRPSILMTPAAFLQRPARWLKAISDYGATITTAPNFGWQLCVDEVGDEVLSHLDLSCLRHALSGAELVRPETVAAFAERFRSCGFKPESFSPVYGLAEAVLLVCGAARTAPARVRSVDIAALAAGRVEPAAATEGKTRDIVSCGWVIPGHDLRIVDPDRGVEVRAGAVGEIWLAGPTVTAGYWGKAEATKAAFEARLADRPEGPNFLRSGDLGAVIDGELYVLGRIKEMVIVRGRKHYAQDLETTVAASDRAFGHDRTVAFGIEKDGEERVVLVHELTRSLARNLDASALAGAARRAVLEVHEIDVATIVFVKPATLPRTTSGKLQRGRAREQFLAGELEVVGAWQADDVSVSRSEFVAPRTETEAQVARAFEALLGIDKIGARDNFFDLGGHSLMAARLVGLLAGAVGKSVPVKAIYDAPTVAALARQIDLLPKGVDRIARDEGGAAVSFQRELDWLWSRSGGYSSNVNALFQAEGGLDAAALGAAVKRLAERHPILRTRYRIVGGQRVPERAEEDFPFFVAIDCRGWDRDHVDAAIKRHASVSLEPETECPMRVLLFQHDDASNFILFKYCGSAVDLWSVDILMSDMLEFYYGIASGNSASPAIMDDGIDYFDYAAHQRKTITASTIARSRAFWAEYLDGIPAKISLPFDRPVEFNYEDWSSTNAQFKLGHEQVARIEHLARATGHSPYIVFLAVFCETLARFAGQEQFCVFRTVSGRDEFAPDQIERVVGLFVSMQPFAVRLAGCRRWRDKLAAIKDSVAASEFSAERRFEIVQLDALRARMSAIGAGGGDRAAASTPLSDEDELAIYGQVAEDDTAGTDLEKMLCQAAFNFYDYRGDRNASRVAVIGEALAKTSNLSFWRLPVDTESTADAYIYFSVIWHEIVEVHISYLTGYFDESTIYALWETFDRAIEDCFSEVVG